ncbi:hypothetical protein [Cerasicoccus arenae]|uniref:YtxH domain-containing protein n=1 Tax=Cerasicoccus arenae TaxID=424488 RepID=A0A8J3D957_9BACT|nr:hypothetical protein [Cerasicoccus arenae]MBK1857677.1 hypothetical protein [Cerasicoccus arenae]GHB91436.1 hypothetical protein GCM10007047_03150 [Cerasicoccus arenae]
MKKQTSILIALLSIGLISLLTGCQKDAGDHLEDAGESISEAAESAGESVSDAAEDAADEVKDATN